MNLSNKIETKKNLNGFHFSFRKEIRLIFCSLFENKNVQKLELHQKQSGSNLLATTV